MNRNSLRTAAVVGLAVAAVAAPAAAAQQDLRSPDTRDAAAATQQSDRAAARWLAYRNAVNAASPGELAAGLGHDYHLRAAIDSAQDLRSPDTRDAAAGRVKPDAPIVEVVRAPAGADDGIHWEDVGIGAGGLLALMLIAGAGAYAVVQRRRGVAAGGMAVSH
ncbi:MAG TPA: hypothetical protein VGF25_10205 [Thermoleophilaceae bacterium]|jgi:hypothetical protein